MEQRSLRKTKHGVSLQRKASPFLRTSLGESRTILENTSRSKSCRLADTKHASIFSTFCLHLSPVKSFVSRLRETNGRQMELQGDKLFSFVSIFLHLSPVSNLSPETNPFVSGAFPPKCKIAKNILAKSKIAKNILASPPF